VVVPSREFKQQSGMVELRAAAWISSATATVSLSLRLAAVQTFLPFPGPACRNADTEIMQTSSLFIFDFITTCK